METATYVRLEPTRRGEVLPVDDHCPVGRKALTIQKEQSVGVIRTDERWLKGADFRLRAKAPGNISFRATPPAPSTALAQRNF